MDDFANSLDKLSGLLTAFIASLHSDSNDRELSLSDLDEIDGTIDQIKEFIQLERDRINAALEAAGGRDVKGDTNRSQKIKATPESAAEYVQNLKV